MRRLLLVIFLPLLLVQMLRLVDVDHLLRRGEGGDGPVQSAPADRPWLRDFAKRETASAGTCRTAEHLLVLGVDRRPGDPGRSDVIALVSFFDSPAEVHVLFIPRDTKVVLRDQADKINAAFAYGGSALARAAVEDLLGIDVDGVVTVDFRAFAGAVDALGGVEVEIAEPMDYEDPVQDLYIHLPPGRQHLDGERALQFVRFRADSRGDVGRIARQQQFLRALAEQHLSAATLLRLPDLWRAVTPHVETTLALGDITRYARLALAGRERILMAQLSGTGVMENDIYYFLTDADHLAAVQEYLRGCAPPDSGA